MELLELVNSMTSYVFMVQLDYKGELTWLLHCFFDDYDCVDVMSLLCMYDFGEFDMEASYGKPLSVTSL